MPQEKPRDSVKTQLLRGTYPRLYIAILVIMVVVSLLRYHLLIRDTVSDASQQRALQLEMIGRYVPENLLQQSLNASATERQRYLLATLDAHPDIQSLEWSAFGNTQTAQRSRTNEPVVPAWFASLATLPPVRMQFDLQAPDGSLATLHVEMRADHALEQGWHTVMRQLPVSALIIVTVFTLLTLLLRVNARLLHRLNLATNALRSGALDARMEETGTLEMRAVAKTFNAMAAEIQRLVLSLQQSKSEHSEQVHFTHQFINALPLPVFVRGQDGTCLGVNKAWEDFFNLSSGTVVGGRLRSDFANFPRGQNLFRKEAVPREDHEIQIQVDEHQVRDMAYFRAPFTLRDGTQAGTIGALVDITDRKNAQAALQAEKERALVTLSSIADGVITTDADGRIESMNEAAQYLTGHILDQALGLPLSSIFRLDHGSQPLPQGLQVNRLHQVHAPVHALNQLLVHRSGERYAIEFTASPIRQNGGNVSGCVLVFRDVTETQELQKKISWQARHDALTGLNNRTALAERLTHAIFQTREAGQSMAVCLLDLDDFQRINEFHGQWVGDRLLKEVGLRLRSFVDDSSDIARLGGDEFVVLLRGSAAASPELDARIRVLLDRLAQPYEIDEVTVSCTASAGVALYPQDKASPDTLLRHADQAMYQAKQAGRGGLHFFDARLDEEVQTTFNRVSRIGQALLDEEFRLFYQPKVNMRTGKIIGFEALLRWQHPQDGLLGPNTFLPLIENTDLIVETGHWVMEQALLQLQEWVAAGQHWVISVNIAARHFHRPDFVDALRALFQKYPDAPVQQLELEILESAALQDVQQMRQMMRECQALGVSFALDDFGTGFSSLSYLKRLPAETIKIDRMFVDGILTDPEDSTLVSAIVGLAQAFDRAVIAEGVENPAQAEKLLSLGCELGQGYGIAKPMPADTVLEWAARYLAVKT
ncbi:MAG: EAL domain-containing protein [Betaproteobacteria bacterium]|nr:EAL domain-containing protein [Betaproteobacteria bacterium]